jgi:hypothetical protein
MLPRDLARLANFRMNPTGETPADYPERYTDSGAQRCD